MNHQNVIYQVNRDDLKELITQVVQDAVKGLQGYDVKTADDGGSDLLTREQVCEYLNVTAATLHNWNKRGYLESIHVGRLVRYRRADVEALARTNNKQ
ncbi:MAG: helix-turn-helix domain-containing protein [Muribaculaceae bacterium]|nr:helix-turn-helix domain-containing protein [Muribaculaceae bacterium]